MKVQITQLHDEHGAPYIAWWSLVDDEFGDVAIGLNAFETADEALEEFQMILEAFEGGHEVEHVSLSDDDVELEADLADVVADFLERRYPGPSHENDDL